MMTMNAAGAPPSRGGRWRDRETLKHVIDQWNANRLDLFSLSEPDENYEFHGVMRYYFQVRARAPPYDCPSF